MSGKFDECIAHKHLVFCFVILYADPFFLSYADGISTIFFTHSC